MTRQSRLWLLAAAGVAAAVAVIVLVFGYNRPPQFPSLYEAGGPTVDASVAFVEYDRHDCVRVLDVASGDSDEIYCSQWVWIEGWDRHGKLRVNADGSGQSLAIDPATGGVERSSDSVPLLDRGNEEDIRVSAEGGRVQLLYRSGDTEVVLIDVECPRDYGFWHLGVTNDGQWVWAVDSEDRLLLVAVDASSGPWLVAEGINDPAWK